MGIKGIKKLINEYSENIFASNISSVVVDTSLFMYKAKNSEKSYGIPFINYFKNQIKWFNRNGIVGVYIFDGPSSELKDETKKKRKENENAVRVTVEDINFLKMLLQKEGIEYIDSDTEADSLCVDIMKERNYDGVLSEDTDILCYGGVLLTGYKSNIKTLIKYDIDNVLNKLEINLIEYVKLCIICGCDYTNGLKGISSIKGYKLIKKGIEDEYLISNIENYLEIFKIFVKS